MSNNNSIGFVETYGMVAAIEAADAMAKAARVTVKTVLNADVGMLSVICEGDLASCQAAVNAGKAAAKSVGKCLSTNLIARPADGVDDLIFKRIGSNITKSKNTPAKKTPAAKGGKAKGPAKK